MTLRTRALIASGVTLVIVVLVTLLLLVQFALSVAASSALQQQLSPVVDSTATLTLEQSDASGALSDYVMLERPSSLDDYRQTIGRATTLLDQIDDAIGPDDADLQALVEAARSAQRAWVKSDPEPVITLMEAGKRQRAMRETNSKEAWATYDAMTKASNDLHAAVNDLRDQAAAAVATFNRVLGLTLIVVFVLVLVGVGLYFLGLQSWVLSPLLQLREDLRRATDEGDHTSPIRPVGPPELRAVGIDAELLRRALVREIDEAEAAREGLVQDAPVVAAMQRELSGDPVAEAPGLVVAGSSQSAEGVVAGDWWDALVRPDGSLALVVADVSGHGPDASVTAVRMRAIIRAGLQSGLAPDAVVAMSAQASDDNHFVTAIVVVIDGEAGTLQWCNAGHHPAIVVTRDKEASLCEPTGPLVSPLGGEWTMQSRDFEPGSVLVAFTDGLVESRNADGDELESSKVSQIIRGMDAPVRENPGELITQLLAQVRHRAADWRRDDVTLVAVARPT